MDIGSGIAIAGSVLAIVIGITAIVIKWISASAKEPPLCSQHSGFVATMNALREGQIQIDRKINMLITTLIHQGGEVRASDYE